MDWLGLLYVIPVFALVGYAIYMGSQGLKNGLIYFAYLKPDPQHGD